MGTTQECYMLFWTNPGSNSCTVTYLPSHKQDMLGTTGEVKTNSLVTLSYGLLYIDLPLLANKGGLTLYGYWMQLGGIDDRDRWWESHGTVLLAQFNDEIYSKKSSLASSMTSSKAFSRFLHLDSCFQFGVAWNFVF